MRHKNIKDLKPSYKEEKLWNTRFSPKHPLTEEADALTSQLTILWSSDDI